MKTRKQLIDRHEEKIECYDVSGLSLAMGGWKIFKRTIVNKKQSQKVNQLVQKKKVFIFLFSVYSSNQNTQNKRHTTQTK